MTFEMKIIFATTVIVSIFIAYAVIRRIPKRLKPNRYQDKWKQLQAYCRDKKTWSNAIIDADKLLEDVLKRRKYKGKTMGQKLVSAESKFTNTDAVWFAHGLSKKVLTDPDARIKEDDVKKALVGFRQALRDLGALPSSSDAASKEGTAKK
jgi:hypothetical protein